MCWKCLNEIKTDEPVSRTAECSFCGTDLHSCKNCNYYSPGSHFDCHETIEENVSDKEKANFCDSFKLKRIFGSGSSSLKEDKAKKALDAFNALFS